MNYLVEVKKEYTITLVNILTPLIYQGMESIYNDAKKASTTDNVLKIFQGFLRRVPKWNNDLIENETNRILSNSRCADWIHDLIKAVIKSNIIILTNNFMYKRKQSELDKNYYEQISLNDFIHKVYIECAREIWNNPYLFFDEYSPIDLKRNQRDTISLIKDSIREAIRKMLPVKHILKEYLGNTMEMDDNDDFETSISDAKCKNIKGLLKKDLTANLLENELNRENNIELDVNKINGFDRPGTPSGKLVPNDLNLPRFSDTSDDVVDDNDVDITLENILEKQRESKPQFGGTIDDIKNMNKEEIINQLKDEERRESNGSTGRNSNGSTGGNSNGSTGRNSNKKSSYEKTSDVSSTATPVKIQKKMNEENIKSILENELYENVSEDSDTSISYTHGNFNDESFEDVFSNINDGGKNINKNEIASIASEIFLNNLIEGDTYKKKNKKKSKKEYFSNYMKV